MGKEGVEYHSAVRKKEVIPSAATWIDLEILTLSEVNPEGGLSLLPPPWGLAGNGKNTVKYSNCIKPTVPNEIIPRVHSHCRKHWRQ